MHGVSALEFRDPVTILISVEAGDTPLALACAQGVGAA